MMLLSSKTERLERAKTDFAAYCAVMRRGFKLPAHIQLLVRALEAVERGELDRLIIEMAPRHGKSESTSQLFPAWYLGKHPDRKILASSYGSDLATGFGRR